MTIFGSIKPSVDSDSLYVRYNTSMLNQKKVDGIFLAIVISLISVGFMIYISASLGTLAESESKFKSGLLSQLVFGLGGGTVIMYLASRVRQQLLRKHAFWLFIGAVALSLLVFVPNIGMEHGGAKRWIDLGITTFQPGEVLKFAVIVYLAAWLTLFKRKIQTPLFGIYPLLTVLGIACVVFIAQRDTGSFIVVACAGIAMYITAGAKWRDIFVIFVIAIIGLGALAVWRPYVLDRFATLWHHDDFQGSGYQLRQSLIAIGSGGIIGKGFGQSVQKFNYLPEAQGDSIFAVASEEFGFVGATFLVLLFVLFALRGLWIAARLPDVFSGLIAVGIVILITSQSFINIASMLGLAPITGVPLAFVSHGGTALFIAMAEVGILLNISRYRRAS